MDTFRQIHINRITMPKFNQTLSWLLTLKPYVHDAIFETGQSIKSMFSM